jgi:crotonobetainyl-CoA:carnitine CoA-transferase CaiB-like acyl-CoA transferase
MTDGGSDLPLVGLKVVDLSWVVAGPAAGRVLADFGATVVRVESRSRIDLARLVGPHIAGVDGVESSACYGNVNAGKLSIALDLSTDPGRDVVRDLVRWCDVVVESFSPGVVARLGLGYEDLRGLNPALVMLSTSLMGQTGPYARFAGSGNVGAALAGFQSIVGWPGELPLGPYGPYTDYVAPRFALVALLAALDHRRRTGEGGYIDLSQVEATIAFLAPQIADYAATGRIPQPAGNRDSAMAPHGVYPAGRDERGEESWIAIAVRDNAEWARLAGLMCQPSLALDARFATAVERQRHAGELDEIVGAWTSESTPDHLEGLLQNEAIPAHRVVSPRDALADTQLQHRNHFRRVEHPLHGETVVEGPRYRLSETPGAPQSAAPTLGANTDHVLDALLGYDIERIDELRRREVLQ